MHCFGVGLMLRAMLVGISTVIAAAIGVVTAIVTTHPSTGLWVSLGALVIVGAVLQAAFTYAEHRQNRRVEASGAASVAIGGSARGEIRTRVHDSPLPGAVPAENDGVIAAGPGAVSIGGDAEGPVSTELSGDKAKRHGV